MPFWEDFLGSFTGRPARTFDPYEKDREARMGVLKQRMGEYDQMMAQPGGAFPSAWRQRLQQQGEEAIRSANPGAGQSGFVEDRVARNKNQINMDLVSRELAQLDKQRGYINQLAGMGQQTQNIPGQGGMLQQGAGTLFGRGVDKVGDMIFGNPPKKDDDDPKKTGMKVTPQPDDGYGMPT